MDGESAQMPIVIGVLRIKKSGESKEKKQFAFTGEMVEPGLGVNLKLCIPRHLTPAWQEQKKKVITDQKKTTQLAS